MTAAPTGQMHRDLQGQWVWLDTLTRLRWLAVAGQLVAILAAWFWFELRFPIGLSLAVVAVSAASNLMNRLLYPRSRRLSGPELFLTQLFDIAQLSLLLYLTGGLHNPFALLLVAPVAIAASTLPIRGTLALGLAAMALATLLSIFFQPLRLPDGAPLLLPAIFLLGLWLAILTGIAFIGLYSHSIARERNALTEALLAAQMALEREQKLTDLGGVVAATAHELGTPLATIKLASTELIDALADDPELAEDARLIREQAQRCSEILRSMGRAGKGDRLMGHAPLETLITEAAAPHADRGRTVALVLNGADGTTMPQVTRRPEIIHGLRNLIQNAVDFAAGQVRVEAEWTAERITIRISDDGPGFPPQLLARIGDPWLHDRRTSGERSRKFYDGMGMGLFIAKTLLERTGARIAFGNSATGESRGKVAPLTGAVATVAWLREDIEVDPLKPLGENQQIAAAQGYGDMAGSVPRGSSSGA